MAGQRGRVELGVYQDQLPATDELQVQARSKVQSGRPSRADLMHAEERLMATTLTPYPCLWFDGGKAEEAATFWISLLPDSRIEKVWRTPADTPSGPAGTVLTVDFILGGQRFQGLNGGPEFTFNEAISLVIECDDQAEVDRLWAALTAAGGEAGPCGWLKDRFGVSWQIVPRRLNELVSDPDPERARRAMEAMLKMGKIEISELERAADARA